jgi:hypothetical protein
MYVEAIYKLLNSGFRARTERHEEVWLRPSHTRPRMIGRAQLRTYASVGGGAPEACRNDGEVDYPAAINCIVKPTTFDCNRVKENKPCNYEGANRPTTNAISHIVVHDIEGTALNALNVFQNPRNGASAHYIVDSDGTVYQVIRERDIAYQAGNLWYNWHSIGIEHAGYDKTGYLWYNATEYLASAKLVAYLLRKYNIPLDHDHIVSHGTVPSPALNLGPNHVDPGPFWLWTYYLRLIEMQGIDLPARGQRPNVVTIVPQTGRAPLGVGGCETPGNFTFFYLYKGPSTASGLIASLSEGVDITNIANNVEAEMSYYYTARVVDPGGTGMLMYRIWFGVQDPATRPTRFAHGQQVWLAVPATGAVEGRITRQSRILSLNNDDGDTVQIWGRPGGGKQYVIGDVPDGATFVSTALVKEQNGAIWYEINYNHRQAWVSAEMVIPVG